MAARDNIVRDLLEKLRDAPDEELSEVAGFVEDWRAKPQTRPRGPLLAITGGA